MDQFLRRCFYHSGQYNSEEDFSELDRKLKEKEVQINILHSKTLVLVLTAEKIAVLNC